MSRTLHLSMREAIERFIADGASVALEGFAHLIPFAAGHEMIRQGRRDCDFGVLTPDPQSKELTLTALFPDVAADQVRAAIGWPLVEAEHLDTIALPSAHELDTLRGLDARTEKSHTQPVRVPLREK